MGFEPTISPSPVKRIIHLNYENICKKILINLLFIYAIRRAFPSEPPNVNPDSGTPLRVFYRPVLVLVSFWDLRTSWLNLFSNLLQSSSIKHQASSIKHQASASSICHHINSTVSNFLLLYYCTCYCNELFIIFSNVLCLVSPVRLMSTKKGEYWLLCSCCDARYGHV